LRKLPKMTHKLIRETTVIVPTYNHSRYLDRCLRSILSQKNYQDFEIICVNDGSKDQSASVLARYESELTILTNSENRGLPFSINRAILESTGRFIIRVDSDDYVSENFLHILTMTLKSNSKIDAAACDYEIVGEVNSNRIVDCIAEPIACGIMFRRDSLFDVGLYDEGFRLHEDKELMSRFQNKYKVTRVPIPLYRYRMHSSNITKNLEDSELYLKKLSQKKEASVETGKQGT